MPIRHIGSTGDDVDARYNLPMPKNNEHLPPELERYLALCKRVAERMKRNGEWPWRDSPDFDNVVESDDNPDNL